MGLGCFCMLVCTYVGKCESHLFPTVNPTDNPIINAKRTVMAIPIVMMIARRLWVVVREFFQVSHLCLISVIVGSVYAAVVAVAVAVPAGVTAPVGATGTGLRFGTFDSGFRI